MMSHPRTLEKNRILPIAERIEQSIMDGTLALGEKLPTEAEWCAMYGVSRTSVREALQHLKQKGLIEAGAGRGMFLRSADPRRIVRDLQLFASTQADEEIFLELLDLRLLIEPANAARAAQKHDPSLLRKLEKGLHQMERALQDLPAFIEQDISMHLLLAEASGNRFIDMLFACLRPLAEHYGAESYDSSSMMRHTLAEHQNLVRAIKSGNAVQARRIMKKHLITSRNHFKEIQTEP